MLSHKVYRYPPTVGADPAHRNSGPFRSRTLKTRSRVVVVSPPPTEWWRAHVAIRASPSNVSRARSVIRVALPSSSQSLRSGPAHERHRGLFVVVDVVVKQVGCFITFNILFDARPRDWNIVIVVRFLFADSWEGAGVSPESSSTIFGDTHKVSSKNLS